MANVNDVFASDYLRAADLQGREAVVTIASADSLSLGTPPKNKIVLGFAGKQKRFVANKTNSLTLASAFGPETGGWLGRSIVLYTVKTPYQGTMTDAIRVRPHYDNPQRHAPAVQNMQGIQAPQAAQNNGYGMPAGGPPTGHPADLDDDIPFAPSF